MIAYSHELYTLYTGCDFHRPSLSHQPPRPRGWAVPWGEPGDGQESGRGAAAADRHWGRTGGRDLVFYQSVYVMLGSVFRGGHFKHIGCAQQCLLRLSVCHHLPQTNTNWMLEYYYTNSINNVVRLYTGQSSFFLHQFKKHCLRDRVVLLWDNKNNSEIFFHRAKFNLLLLCYVTPWRPAKRF